MNLLASSAIALAKADKFSCNSRTITKLLLIMKLTATLILISALHVSATTFSQRVTVQEENISLSDIFKKIRIQSGYQFVYKDEVIKDKSPVSINLKDAEISEVLKVSLKDQNLDFEITEIR